jgi:hypothetical protein
MRCSIEEHIFNKFTEGNSEKENETILKTKNNVSLKIFYHLKFSVVFKNYSFVR